MIFNHCEMAFIFVKYLDQRCHFTIFWVEKILDLDLLGLVVNSILLLKAAIIKSQMHLVQLFHQGICPFLSYNFIVLCIFDKKMFLIQVALEWFKTLDKLLLLCFWSLRYTFQRHVVWLTSLIIAPFLIKLRSFYSCEETTSNYS